MVSAFLPHSLTLFVSYSSSVLCAGHMPDYACLIIGANMGVVGMCKEHMGVALALKVTPERSSWPSCSHLAIGCPLDKCYVLKYGQI